MRISRWVRVLGAVVALGISLSAASASPGKFVLGTAMLSGNNPQVVLMKFNWQPSAGASRYLLEVSLMPDFGKVLIKKETTSNMAVLSKLPAGETVYWRVFALSSDGSKVVNSGEPKSIGIPRPEVIYKPITIPQSTPVLDGKVSPGEWDKAPVVPLVNFACGVIEPADATPTARLMWDKTNIYALLEAATPKGRPVSSFVKERDGGVYQDDAMELFFQEKDDMQYYQFIVNASGSKWDGRSKDVTWNCDWQSAQGVDGANLVIEVAIPWAAIAKSQPKVGVTWKGNLCADFSNQAVVRSWSKVYFFIDDPKFYHAFILGK